MSEPTRSASYVLEHLFPHPIAAAYRCAKTAEGKPEAAVYYVAAVDQFLRTVGAVLLADFFTKQPSAEKVAPVLKLLAHPTLCRWGEAVVELSCQLWDKRAFVPDVARVLGEGRRPSKLAQEMMELAGKCDEMLEEKGALLDPVKSMATAEELEAHVEGLFGHFQFLEKYPLVVFHSHSSVPETGFRGFMVKWIGYRAQPLPVSVELEGPAVTDTPMLITEDASRGLVLAPFVKVGRQPKREGEALFVVSGLRHEHCLRLEHFGSGRFLTEDLVAEGMAVDLPRYMESWKEGGLATLQPAKGSLHRIRFQSKLLPSEKVLEGRYKPVGFIGRGGIGAVYRVYDLAEKREKALKILYPDLSRNEFFTRYFLETGGLLASLKHANVVPVHEAAFSSTLQENHIVMEYMPGGSLEEVLAKREVLPPKHAVAMAAMLADGLAYLHGNGLIHGAVHPGNVLFAADGTACVGDFGILKLPSSRMATFRPLERIHSVRYAAPELLLGGQVSPQADVYSLALVLYEALTGQLPSKTEFVPPSQLIFPIPELLDRVLEIALAANPADRYAGAVEFARALRSVLEGMGEEYEVAATATAQQVAGHLTDVQSGGNESIDVELAEKLKLEDFEAAARLMQMRVDQIWDIDEKVYWMLRLAELYFDRLKMPGKAVAIYRECIEQSPENSVAVRALVEHYRKTEEWEELAILLEELREQTASDEAAVEYLKQLFEVYHVRIGNPAAAGEYLAQLVEKTGAKREWIEQLVGLKEEAEDWEGAAKALETWLEHARGPEERVGILKKLGELYHQKVEDFEAATATFEALLEMAPVARGAMDSLRSLYRMAFAYASLAALLKRMIASGLYSKEETIELYQELGEIVSSYVYESREAIQVWGELMALDPENQTAMSYLERIYLREGQNDRYLEMVERRARCAARPEEKANILMSAALAKLEFMQDAAGARTLLEEGLALQPGHQGIEAALERLYDEHQDAEAASRLLLARLDRETDPVKRRDLLLKLAQTFEKGAGDRQAAIQVMRQLFRENPRDPGVRAEIERLARETGTIEELIVFYVEEIPAATTEGKGYMAARVAQLAVQHVRDRGKALTAIEKVSEQVPNHELVLRTLMGVYRDLEKWGKLARAMLQALQVAEEEARAELFEEAVLLVKNRLSGTEEGKGLLAELARALPQVRTAGTARALRDACRTMKDWGLLAEQLRGDLEQEKDPLEALELRLELAGVLLETGEYAKAAEQYAAVFEKTPHDPHVQQGLEAALYAQERWDGLLKLYRRLVPILDEAEARAAVMKKAAEIEVRVNNNLDAAADLYRQLSSMMPEKLEYQLALADVLRKAARFPELSWLYEQMVQNARGEDRVRLLKEMGQLYSEQLRNPDAAVQALRQVMKLVPEDYETFDRVRKLCLEEKRFEVLLRAMADRAKHAEKPEKLALMVDMARISAMEMGLLPPAKNYLEEVLRTEPGQPQAFDLYVEILSRQEDWRELARLLERQFDAVSDEKKKVALGLQLAELYVTRLDHTVRACEVLEKVLEVEPQNAKAALSLARQYGQLQRWDKTAPLLVILQEFAGTLSDAERAEYSFLSAQTYEALLQRKNAIAAYRSASALGHRVGEAKVQLAVLLYLEEAYEEARALLAELVAGGALSAERTREFQNMLADIDRKLGRRERSREHLEAMLAKAPGDKAVLAKLVDLMREEKDREGEAKYIEQILQVETEPQRRFAMFTRLGDLQRDMTGGEGAATEAYEKASQINPSSKAILIQLGQLYLKLARYDDAARVLFDAESLETEREKKASLAMSLGVMYAEYVKDPARAAPHLWRCLEYEPAKWDAFSTLERLAVDSGDWEQQRKLYRFALDRLGDRAGADLGYKLHFNLGKILLEKFGDSAAALEHLQEAARRKPDQMEPREILAGIYSQTADQLDLALAEYRLLLDRDPRNVNLLHMLRKTLSNMKRFDGAWCVTGILELLGAATPKEKAFYQKFASAALKIKPKPIELEMFKNGLVADSQEWELTEIVRVLFERLAPKLPLKSAKDVGLTRRLDAAEKSHQLAMRLIEIVSKVLGIPEPAAYFRELAAWVGKEACFPPALVVGPSALDGKRGKELRFELGKVLALFIPHHGAVGVLDRDTLRAMLGNVSKLIAPQMPDPPGDARAHAEMRATIQKLLPAAELVKVKDWLAALRARGGEVSVKRWLVGVEKTCGRVGLLMANDLQVAATVTRTAPDPLSSASREEMVDDLIRFTVSEPFELIRAHLGISVV